MRVGAAPSDGISDYLKCHITSDLYGITVVGYIAEGSSGQLSNTWNAPFEGDSVGSMPVIGTVANLGQSSTNMTTVTQHNSEMIWQGVQSPSFNLTLYFQAMRNAKTEVNDAITYLMQMASPDLNEYFPGGRPPQVCTMDIGRRIKLLDMVIQDVSYELDAPRTGDGYFTHNTVTLQCCAKRMLNAPDLPTIFVA